MSSRNLGKLYSRFFSKTERLISSFGVSMPMTPRHSDSCKQIKLDGQEREIVKLQIYWGNFCEELVVKSSVGGYQTLSGNVLMPATISNVANIYSEATSLVGGAFFPWHIPSRCTQLALGLGTVNIGQIQLGLGLLAPIDNLRDTRNYIVHPSRQTQIAFSRVAMRYGQPNATPSQLLSAGLPGGATLFDSWVEDLRMMAEVAVK